MRTDGKNEAKQYETKRNETHNTNSIPPQTKQTKRQKTNAKPAFLFGFITAHGPW
jgi:hypothetical protein